MNLNKLERTFFEDVVNVELEVPIHATLTHQGKDFEIIVVPRIDDKGFFKFDYFNAPEFRPEPTKLDNGRIYSTFVGDEMFGANPDLVDAWRKRTPVKLNLKPSRSPMQFKSIPSLDARVLYVGLHNRGSLGIYNSQAVLGNSPLKVAKFSISTFTDFVNPAKQLSSIGGLDERDRADLQRVSGKLGDGASLALAPSQETVVLDTGDGWKITITKDRIPEGEEVTHTGIVEKVDATEFCIDELGQVMEGVRLFFAFTMVKYCFPSVLMGYDSDQKTIFGEVGKFESDRETPVNWFHHGGEGKRGHVLEHFFPRFWSKWKAHAVELTEAIDCYVTSLAMIRAGILRDSVPKSCGGLEIIAGLILGSAIAHDPTSPIDKVLKCYRIPHRILDSSNNPACSQLCSGLNVVDKKGAALLINVRNYITHPLEKNTITVKLPQHQSLDDDKLYYLYLHDLSQFYFEYLVLRLCAEGVNMHRKLLEAS